MIAISLPKYQIVIVFIEALNQHRLTAKLIQEAPLLLLASVESQSF